MEIERLSEYSQHIKVARATTVAIELGTPKRKATNLLISLAFQRSLRYLHWRRNAKKLPLRLQRFSKLLSYQLVLYHHTSEVLPLPSRVFLNRISGPSYLPSLDELLLSIIALSCFLTAQNAQQKAITALTQAEEILHYSTSGIPMPWQTT